MHSDLKRFAIIKRWLLILNPWIRAYNLWDGGLIGWEKVRRITAELNVS